MSAARTVDDVRALVGDLGGGTSASHGAEIFDWVREHRPQNCLELGFAWGVGAAYIAAALEANGEGHLTSVDLKYEERRAVVAQEMLERGGLAHRSDVVLEDTSYNWFLHRKLKEQTDKDQVTPLYDFVFLDGAHTWPDDALALMVVERLMKPGGWIHLDDLAWLPTARTDYTEEQRSFSHVLDIWDLLVVPHPGFDELRTDGYAAWARKSPDQGAPVRTVYKQDVARTVRSMLQLGRATARRARARASGGS